MSTPAEQMEAARQQAEAARAAAEAAAARLAESVKAAGQQGGGQ